MSVGGKGVREATEVWRTYYPDKEVVNGSGTPHPQLKEEVVEPVTTYNDTSGTNEERGWSRVSRTREKT